MDEISAPLSTPVASVVVAIPEMSVPVLAGCSSAAGTEIPTEDSTLDAAFWAASGRTPAAARPVVPRTVPATTRPATLTRKNLDLTLDLLVAGTGECGVVRLTTRAAAVTACCSAMSSVAVGGAPAARSRRATSA